MRKKAQSWNWPCRLPIHDPVVEANRRLGDGQMKVRKFPSDKDGKSGLCTSLYGLFSLN